VIYRLFLCASRLFSFLYIVYEVRGRPNALAHKPLRLSQVPIEPLDENLTRRGFVGATAVAVSLKQAAAACGLTRPPTKSQLRGSDRAVALFATKYRKPRPKVGVNGLLFGFNRANTDASAVADG
jgi:hypothetical protein